MVLKKAYVLEYKVTESLWNERVKENAEESETAGGLNFGTAYQTGEILHETFPISPTANQQVHDRFDECKKNKIPVRIIHGEFYLDDDGRATKVNGKFSLIEKYNWQ